MGRSRKLCLVSVGVYPGTGGSVIIVNNIARTFSKEDMVIIGQRQARTVRRPWSPEFPKLYYLDVFELPKRRGHRYTRWFSARSLKKQIRKIVLDEQCDCILAIFPDELFMYCAYSVSQDLGLPFFTWFHNTYLDNRRGVLKLLAHFLQPKFFLSATCNFVISDGLRRFYEGRYPSTDFVTLLHGFDVPKRNFIPYELPSEKVRFLFSGTLNHSCLDAALRLFEAIVKGKNHELHIFTGDLSFFRRHDFGGENVFFHNFLPLDEFVAKLTSFDVLLLPHGFEGDRSEAEYRTIFPTRTIPLLYSNRPILVHSPRDCFLTRFFIENNCGVVVTEKSEQQLVQAIDVLKTDAVKSHEVVKNALAVSKLFEVSHVRTEIMNRVLRLDPSRWS